MKEIFKKLGINISERREEGASSIKVLYIKNTDGTVRWIWNAKNSKPLFLKFYNVSSFKSRVYSLLIQLIFIIRIQKLFFKQKKYFYSSKEDTFFKISDEWALFTGTVGPNNKLILYSDDHFYKIADTENSQALIENERTVLEKLNQIQRYYLYVPQSEKINNKILKTSNITEKGRRWNQISYVHSWVLIEMSRIFSEKTKMSDWELFQTLKTDFTQINDQRIPKGILKKLNTLLAEIDEEETVELTFSHGDFTPWNSYVSEDKKLSVYDWEMASNNKPKGFDFFHFIIQNGILVQRKSWKEIYAEIVEKNKTTFNFSDAELQKYLKYYLVINTLQYLKIYSQQQVWHPQIYWLLSIWNDAFNPFLKEKYSNRELVILDFFDIIYAEKYATLKFPDVSPENLSVDADIDVVTQKGVAKKVISYFKKHSLVHKIILDRKSFLKNLTIITNDFGFLSIDCIEQLKWKNLNMLNSTDILTRSETNDFGIKKASNDDTAKYILLFYTLNNAKVPEKYKHFIHKEITDKNNFDEKTNKQSIIKLLKKQPSNKGLNYLNNTLNYFMDMFSRRGFIVTFSGVDGAGKSTVILNIVQMIENRFRKPVKVLRHRPALLPILSVWTKGEKTAHHEAQNSLPRQGNNNSFISSMFRFFYYYIDYLLGQFWIYFVYVRRGYIVVYDRYYFDFIADSKRSNIILPKFLARFGYHFLIQANYNFFLYADPETILKRKQELSYQTIKRLTYRYQKLFFQLKKNNLNRVYQSIDNQELDKTLHQIMQTVFLAK